jgi:hypothetical protein
MANAGDLRPHKVFAQVNSAIICSWFLSFGRPGAGGRLAGAGPGRARPGDTG